MEELVYAEDESLILIKPDAVNRKLVGKIISRFEDKGIKILNIKYIWPTEEQVRAYYREHQGKEFYERLVQLMLLGPVIAMIVRARFETIKTCKTLIGAAGNPCPGTIRADYQTTTMSNCVRASNSLEAFFRERQIWF